MRKGKKQNVPHTKVGGKHTLVTKRLCIANLYPGNTEAVAVLLLWNSMFCI